MKIAFISYWSCPLTRLGVLRGGGMNVYVLNLADSLGKLGYQIDIYTRSHRENDERIIETHPNVRVIHLAGMHRDLYSDILLYSNRLRRFIQKNSLFYDILHTHYYYSGLAGLALEKRLSIPTVITFHTLGAMKDFYGGIKDAGRIKAERRIIDQIDGIIASTPLEEKDLIEAYQANRKKIIVMSPGVNHHIFKKYSKIYSRKTLKLPQEKKIILFIGRIDPIKGISQLIEAVGKLAIKYSSFKNNFEVLLIGGDISSRQFWKNNEVRKILKLIEEKHLGCCVKFIGSVQHNLLPYYYSASDVTVMPSVYESFGFVVLEAMACGSAVLASKVGGLKYLIRDGVNGRLFEMGNTNQLSDLIWELVNDEKQRIKLGYKAIKSSQRYCWDKQAQKIVGIYKHIIHLYE